MLSPRNETTGNRENTNGDEICSMNDPFSKFKFLSFRVISSNRPCQQSFTQIKHNLQNVYSRPPRNLFGIAVHKGTLIGVPAVYVHLRILVTHLMRRTTPKYASLPLKQDFSTLLRALDKEEYLLIIRENYG